MSKEKTKTKKEELLDKLEQEDASTSLNTSPPTDISSPSKVEGVPDFEELYKRALADYQNLQREVVKERQIMGVYCLRNAVEPLLPILDNFRAATAALPTEALAKVGQPIEGWAQGIGFIQKQMEDALTELGVKKIATVGETFDANRHEAVSEEESKEKSGTILKETCAGYTVGETVIRPAKVIISK